MERKADTVENKLDEIHLSDNANVDAGRQAERIHRMTLGGII